MNIRLIISLILSLLSLCSPIYAHPSYSEHVKDMRGVLGLKSDERVNNWLKLISSDMIDNIEFHKMLDIKYGLNLSSASRHRMLFHWSYDSEPWSFDLDTYIRRNCQTVQGAEDTIRAIRLLVIEERKRRNKKINQKTEQLFGFSSGGIEAKYARMIAALVYDIHILGDYESDNSCFSGLPIINTLLTHIQSVLKDIDEVESRNLRNKIEFEKMSGKSHTQKADIIMPLLILEVPSLLKKARGGFLKRKIESRGFLFVE